MNELPLLERGLDEPLANLDGRTLSVGEFLGLALTLAGRLPDRRPVINLCQNRTRFSIGFAAALLSGGHNLLPANRLPATVDALLRDQPNACVLSDCAMDHIDAPVYHPSDLPACPPARSIPSIPSEQLAAVVFTSGSTGSASRIIKSWSTLYHSSRLNQRWFGAQRLLHTLATVPPQHMWGLETSVLLPWFGPMLMDDGQPFFASDIISALERLPEPRALVSAPIHLRVLDETDVPLPNLDTIYSATAPLGPEVAKRLESATSARVIEIYGCAETGCLARRRSAKKESWQLFSAFELVGGPQRFCIKAAHLPESVELMDTLRLGSEGSFELVGRSSDLINIAGKRASLAELTRILLDIPGVIDGVIFQPPERTGGRVERLAALVVAPGLEKSELHAHLAQRVDGAFLPRPLRLVEALPRAESGKLPRHALIDLFRQVAQPTSG